MSATDANPLSSGALSAVDVQFWHSAARAARSEAGLSAAIARTCGPALVVTVIPTRSPT